MKLDFVKYELNENYPVIYEIPCEYTAGRYHILYVVHSWGFVAWEQLTGYYHHQVIGQFATLQEAKNFLLKRKKNQEEWKKKQNDHQTTLF